MSVATFEFPSPVGGVPFPSDFAPSVIFALMYGSLIPLLAYRILDGKSRNVMLIGTAAFTVERVVIFSLRAVQSHNESRRTSKGLTTYMQITIGMGFINVAQDLINLLRVLLVNSTNSPMDSSNQPTYINEEPLVPTSQTPLHTQLEQDSIRDQPHLRFRYRRLTDILKISFIGAIVPGVIGNSHFSTGIDDEAWAQKVMRLRYGSTAVALLLITAIMCSARWAVYRISYQRRKAISLLVLICSLLLIPAIYRLAVMYNKTDSLTSTSASSLNMPVAKATFYIFHMLPEWISMALLLVINIRELFGTGTLGDWRSMDETKRQKERREAKEAKAAEKKRAKSKPNDLIVI